MGTRSTAPSAIAIEGVSNATIARYFEILNREDYESVAELFAADGALLAPFEEPLVGSEAIATYLAPEAKGMRLFPRQGTCETLEDGNTRYHITGKVQTSLFGVNVAWFFILNPASEIESVQVKLLAAPQDLLKLRDLQK